MRSPGDGEPGPERVRRIEHQRALAGDPGTALDERGECILPRFEPAGEETAGDALLAPSRTWREHAACVEDRHPRGRAGAAGRAIIRPAGTEHEIPAVGVVPRRRTGELDMLERRAVRAGHAGVTEHGHDGGSPPRER